MLLSRGLRLRRLYPVTNSSSQIRRCLCTEKTECSEEEPWKDPWKHAIKQQKETLTGYEEIPIDWKYVERLMPHKVIPEIPKHESYPTPSGWRPPNPSCDLPYYIARLRTHTLPLFLERRRDQLDPKTMEFEYVELVVIRNIHGDIFACEKDLREYLENELKHPIATNVDELKGLIRVKGADRTLIEKFLFDAGF